MSKLKIDVVVNDGFLEEIAEDINKGKKGAIKEWINTLADHLTTFNHIITTPSWEMYCYAGSIYQECENHMKMIVELYGREYGVEPYITRNVIGEVIEKVKRLSYKNPQDLETNKWWLALKNGLFNIRKWVEAGEVEVKEYSPEIFKTAYINAEFKGLPDGMNDDNWLEYGSKLCPTIHKAFSEWVDPEDVKTLYEIIGYCLYPDYPLHTAVMLVGEGANGKSTYLRLIKTFLGKDNSSAISLQQLAENRFMPIYLYNKLANIFPDIPSTPLRYTGMFKALTGQDEIQADVKHRDPVKFMNYAKLIFSANELPGVTDQTYAFWRRWIVIKFPHKFPQNPEFINELTKPEELNGLFIMALFALREVMKSKQFDRSGSFKDFWMRHANTVYAFITDKITYCPAKEECIISRDELYKEYVSYCEDNDLAPVTQTKFTQEFKRLAGKRVEGAWKYEEGKTKRAWKGIKIKGEDQQQRLVEWSETQQ